MRIMTAKEASEYCKQNKFRVSSWDCGYALEAYLELDCNIKLENENSWTELEDILYYKAV